MPFYKDYDNKVHFLESAEFAPLLPAGCVAITDQEAVERQRPPAPLIADLRAALHARINDWRDEQERGVIVFEHAGRSWDGGLHVRTRLQPVLSLAEMPHGFFWTDAANNDVPMTMPELQALNVAHEAAIVTRGFEIHVRQRAMKSEVAALATIEAAQAYVIGWSAA